MLNFSSIALMLLLTLLNLWPIPLIFTLTILIVSAFDYLLCPCPFIFALDTDSTSPVREYASFGRKQWSTSPTITWSPWRWSFSKHTKWWRRERKVYWSKFWFILVLLSLLSFHYYELGSTLRTARNHSCAVVFAYCALSGHYVLTA